MNIFDFGKTKEPRLFQYLLDHNIIDRKTLKLIKHEKSESNRSTEDVLLDYIDRKILLDARVKDFGEKYLPVDLIEDADNFPAEDVTIFPLKDALKYKTVVLQKKGNNLAVAMVNPRDDFAQHIMEEETGCTIMARYICLERDLNKFIRMKYQKAETEEALQEIAEEEIAVSARKTMEESLESLVGVRQIVDAVIQKAIDKGASDVHLEPYRDSIGIRYRVDGILESDPEIDRILDRERRTMALHNAFVNIIKNRSGASGKDMRLDEKEKPQDGRIYIQEADLDLRVSVIPCLYGESIVIRLHNREVGMFTLDKLGFESEDLQKFKRLIQLPYGMLLSSGPTGSGKTTTLYSVMQMINDPTKKTLTIEDPIEYSIKGAIQAQTNPAKNFTFDKALMSFLRHDPDIIMIGEIRDAPTASMAVEAALTGHLVLSSIHANDAVSTVTRLKDLGIDPRLVTSTCVATLAQRLVRRNCEFCREPHKFSTRLFKVMNRYKIDYNTDTLMKGNGCDICKGTGYHGRIGIFELMEMTFEMKEMVLQGATHEQMEEQARSQGMKTLLEDALHKVAAGVTTEEEVWRVTLLGKAAG
ncbi:MAG: GspE/PulE family protein [Vulcanimicrobiota bacterium]